jgi:uncharacterized protein (DUF433 family)
MPVVAIEHIDVDEKGVARIAGTRMKVIHLVMDKMANGWTPEEIQAQHPHLTLSQVHAAFAYYYDHKAELDTAIQQTLDQAEALRKELGESPIVAKLRALGKLP